MRKQVAKRTTKRGKPALQAQVDLRPLHLGQQGERGRRGKEGNERARESRLQLQLSLRRCRLETAAAAAAAEAQAVLLSSLESTSRPG